MNFYIGDLHFGHSNILKYDNRPFESVEDMMKTILCNWNSIVTKHDDVYILGDVNFSNKWDEVNEFMRLANGKKHLIRGNHDSRLNKDLVNQMVEVVDYKELKDNGTRVVLCHYPIAHWNRQYNGAIHLYAHIHNSKDYDLFREYIKMCREHSIPAECYNVGCMIDYMNYTPRTLKHIKEHCDN